MQNSTNSTLIARDKPTPRKAFGTRNLPWFLTQRTTASPLVLRLPLTTFRVTTRSINPCYYSASLDDANNMHKHATRSLRCACYAHIVTITILLFIHIVCILSCSVDWSRGSTSASIAKRF